MLELCEHFDLHFHDFFFFFILSESTQQNLIYVIESATFYTKLGTKYTVNIVERKKKPREEEEANEKVIIKFPHALIQNSEREFQ